MSGDVQPRKRKDKKKHKDDDGYSTLNDDVNIHVHKEGGTGGNICAKIVFFFLFSALIVLVGLIIKENQGLTELEEIESESRYSQIFEGWVDKSTNNHEDDHSPELSQEHDNHDLEEEDDHYESEEDNVEESQEEQSEEADEDDKDQEEYEDSATRSEEETNEETEEEDQVPESEEDQVPESEEDNTVEEDNTEEVDEQSESQEKDKTETEEVDDNISEADKDDDVDDDEDTKEKDESKEQSIEENDYNEISEEVADKSKEDRAADKSERVVKEPELKKYVSKEAVKDIKEESKEEEGEEEILEKTLPVEKQEEEDNNEPVTPRSGMATKIGVGIALLAVAYNVFFRKRSPDKPLSRTVSEKEPTPDLSRRNTIVPPLSLQEVEPDLPEFEGPEEEYSEEEYSDEDSRSEHRSARDEYQELRSTYTRSLTPDGNFEGKDITLEEEILEHEDDIEEEELEEEEEEELEDEEEIEDDYDKYDDDEDEELLKRLEAKYGKLGREVNVGEEVESDSDKEDYQHSDITNKDDNKIKADIDAAQGHLNKNAAYANTMFEAILGKHPLSPRTLYGKARSLDILAEEKQSNELLQQALDYYMKTLNAPNVPDPLFVIVAERYIDRARFIGHYKKAVSAHWQLIERFPDNSTYANNLAVTYLTINLIDEARSVLKRVLTRWPNDGFALVHYGFILKTADNNLEESVHYMIKGLKTKEAGVIDGRFYFHLGDALTRLGKNKEAMNLYEEGVQEKLFMSKYQRSLYNVPRLTAKPWWEPADFPSYQKLFLALKDNWQDIRKEGLSALNDQGYFRDEAESLMDTGTWKQLELFARGQKFTKNCAKNPVTCRIIQNFPDARSCRRGQTKFSVMHPGTHVWPHCGPTNCRLRIHLGLKVPSNTFIRVADETRSWKEGDVIIFDDSFEHEVWHNGSDFRLVLIVDVWHPELTPSEKKSLSSI